MIILQYQNFFFYELNRPMVTKLSNTGAAEPGSCRCAWRGAGGACLLTVAITRDRATPLA